LKGPNFAAQIIPKRPHPKMIEPLRTDSVDRDGGMGLGMTESFFEQPILNSP
jgi:hypothetical protein